MDSGARSQLAEQRFPKSQVVGSNSSAAYPVDCIAANAIHRGLQRGIELGLIFTLLCRRRHSIWIKFKMSVQGFRCWMACSIAGACDNSWLVQDVEQCLMRA